MIVYVYVHVYVHVDLVLQSFVSVYLLDGYIVIPSDPAVLLVAP